MRPSGGGHVAVMERKAESGYQYVCFQNNSFREDVTREVNEKKIKFSFCPYAY
jgi:hypothetical protein